MKRIKPVVRVVKINARICRIGRGVASGERPLLELEARWIPRVDIFEKRGDIVVECEVPGIQSEDIAVSVLSHRIEIQGFKRETRLPGEARFLRLEREYGRFRRVVPLPVAVDPDRVEARLDNGILTVILRKMGKKKKEIDRRT